MSASNNSNEIQQDWEDREFVQIIEMNLMKTIKFLNEFDVNVRIKVANLNEKLTKLERVVEYCEAAIKSSQDRMESEKE